METTLREKRAQGTEDLQRTWILTCMVHLEVPLTTCFLSFCFFGFSSRFVFSCRICVFFAAVWQVFAGVLAGFCGRFAAHGTLRKIAAVCGEKRYENQNNQKKFPFEVPGR